MTTDHPLRSGPRAVYLTSVCRGTQYLSYTSIVFGSWPVAEDEFCAPRQRAPLVLAGVAFVALVAGCNGKSGGSHEPRRFPVPAEREPANGCVVRGLSAEKAWRVPEGVAARKWRYIVIHHSGTDEGSAAAFDRYHRNVKGWKDLAYHFVIGNGRGTSDGAVEAGPRWKEQRVGAHAGVQRYNDFGIGVCLVGNFEKSVPTKKQRQALGRLLSSLMKRYGIPAARVKRHSDIVQTKCPGRRFPWPVTSSK